MASFDSEKLTRSVHAVLRTAAALTHGSMVFPYKDGVVWEERRASRAAPLGQWVLERDTFETEVVRQYSQLSTSEVRELVAGTGVGKSTKMPYLIAKHHRVNGLVLLPNDFYPLHIVTFLKQYYAQLGGEVSVMQLRSVHYLIPAQTPCVYYASAATFLGRFASRPTLLSDLGIDFIFLDESHERVPSYDFFKYAVSSGLIQGCKVFYGTATASADISVESGSVGRTVQAVPESVLSVSSPSGATARSPLHYANITTQTKVILADDREIEMWFGYYNAHDVPVYKGTMAGGTRPLCDIEAFLRSHPLCVVLVTGQRSSVTHDIGCVVDGGYHTVVRTDFSGEPAVKLVREPISVQMRVQACGRVGRHRPGKAYYADVEPTHEGSEFTVDNAFYIYLWSQVFSLKINDPAISEFATVTGPLSAKAAAILLHTRLPPALMLPYVGNDGFYDGWSKVGSYVLYSTVDDATDFGSVNTESWTSYTTGHVDYASESMEFKALVRFPREWNVIPAYAWALYKGAAAAPRALRAYSVVSGTPSEYGGRTARDSVMSVNTVASHSYAPVDRTRDRARPVTPFQRNSVATEPVYGGRLEVPTLDVVRSAVASRDSIGRVATPSVAYGHVRSGSGQVVDAPSASAIDVWRGTLPQSPKEASLYRVGSDSSDERSAITLRKVDPVKYKLHKLYPMDPDAFRALIDNEQRSRRDRSRTDNLLTGAENLTGMSGDVTARKEKQSKYFLSVLRVHNFAVTQKAQIGSNVKMSVVERAVMSLNGDMNRVDEDINETAKLLRAFQIESWFVGVDRRHPRSSSSDSDIVSPDHDYEEARAKIMMSFGPPAVVSVLEFLVARSVPYVVGGHVVCNAWAFGECVVTVGHAYDDTGVSHQSAVGVVEDSRDEDFVIFRSSGNFPGTVVTRAAKAVENVYVLTYDKYQNKVVVLGDYTLVSFGEGVYLHAVLEKGNSGALVVAVDDGAVLGMYSAFSGTTSGTPMSIVVGAAKFQQYLN